MFSPRVPALPGDVPPARLGRVIALVLLSLLFGGVLLQGTLALAISPVDIWAGGIYDDAPQADIPMASSQLAALPTSSSAGDCVPARVVGMVSGTRESGCSIPLLEVSRSRAPPLG